MDTQRYRTGLKRLWAAIVDGIVLMPLLLIDQWLYKKTDAVSILFIWTALVSIAPLIYSIVLHYKKGFTIGKWVAEVKVLDISETRKLSLRQAIFRDSFYLAVALGGLIYYSILLVRSDDKQMILSNYSSFSINPIFWWTLIELVTMLTNSKRRASHDCIARSIVVRTKTGS